MEKVGNAYVLVNLVSRRVRQLNYGGGGAARPLVANTENMAAADIALREIVEGSMGWDMPEWVQVTRPVAKKRKKSRSRTAEAPRNPEPPQRSGNGLNLAGGLEVRPNKQRVPSEVPGRDPHLMRILQLICMTIIQLAEAGLCSSRISDHRQHQAPAG